MSEYKDTLNLPHTSFPMKANLAMREPQMLQAWEKQNIYQQIRIARQGAKPFILHDGPPYANGNLHCGHALNKILKDIIVKSKVFSGYDAPFIPGWDCHGLPIELNVEKKFGKAGVKISPEDFRQKCRSYAQSQIDIQREEFKRLGVFGDWEHPYTTMDYAYEANIVRALGEMIKHGHVQQGFKPVHWCVDCGSALAEAEVDYEDKLSPSIDVAFIVDDTITCIHRVDRSLAIKPVTVPIWTTTPWTLPANEAVSLHPKLEYVLCDVGSRYFIVAKDLVEQVMGRYGIEKFTIQQVVPGQIFEHLSLRHPFNERLVPIVLAEHVTVDAGTGCVHTAPAHGPDDYLVGKKYNLPLINPVLGNGCYSDHVPLFTGKSVLRVNEAIIDLLREKDVLLHQETVHHSYPHCWRHKTPVIFRATPQWFIAMDKSGLREQLLNYIDSVEWIPDWGKARMRLMIENRPDWCISRQRAWGTPIPLFLHKTTRALHPRTIELLEIIALKIEQRGIDAWFELDIVEILGEDAGDYEKSNDTLDVWFDSGVSHFCVLKTAQSFPADVYLEGSDQYRGWFNSSFTTAVGMMGKPPYKTVLTHGYTVDAEGKKLSKSKGNYVSLDKLIKQHGADILRLWVASSDYRYEVNISDEIIKRNADAYRRIRNTVRFLLANLFDFDPALHQVSADKMVALDRWAIARCKMLQQAVEEAYDDYQFHVIYQKLHHFCAMDMGSFYLDIIKDRQYTIPKDSVARRSCQTAMYHIIQSLVRLMAPILSFTAEEIWQAIPGQSESSVFLQQWYADWPLVTDVDMQVWERIQQIRDEVNKALELKRKEGIIGSGLAADVTLYAALESYDILNALEDELRFVLITSTAKLLPIKDCSADALHIDALGLAVDVQPSPNPKCVRCWHRRAEIGTNVEHPELCYRCVDNIYGKGEVRQFA